MPEMKTLNGYEIVDAAGRERIAALENFDYTGYGIPVVYFEGDISLMNKDNAVTLNYIYGERSGTCTLKWQGSSSIAYPKKNYTVKFDNAFEAKEGWGEQKKYCLKADWIDFSHCRNICSARLWGEIVKSRTGVDTRLSSLVNGGAIDGFPCFVVINGEWKGIYNFNIPKDGWMMGMGSGEKEAILCAGGRGTQAIFRQEATVAEDGASFDLEYNSDTFSQEEIQTSLNTLINACINSDGTDIDTTIAQYLDINSAIDYYIFSVVTKNIDGIAKNNLLCTYDGVKWFFSAYDLDSTFGLYYDGKSFQKSGYSLNPLNWASDEGTSFWSLQYNRGCHRVFELLYKYKKTDIIARYDELRKRVITTSNISDIVRDYTKTIPLSTYNADCELWKAIPSTGANRPEQICDWIADRLKSVDDEIAQMNIMVEEKPTDGLVYASTSNNYVGWTEAECEGIGSATDTDIVIASYARVPTRGTDPAYYNDLPVTKLYPTAFANNTTIASVKIPDTVREIGSGAFRGCSALTEIDIPDSVTKIGDGAFSNGVALNSLRIPKNLTSIGAYFIYGNSNLTTLELPNKVKELGYAAFDGCSNVTKLKLSNNLEIIGASALKNFKNLTSTMIIPKTVKTIASGGLARWWSCPKAVFKGTPESIADDALFELGGISSVTEVNIYVPWAEGAVAGAPWGATKATIHYNSDVDNIN